MESIIASSAPPVSGFPQPLRFDKSDRHFSLRFYPNRNPPFLLHRSSRALPNFSKEGDSSVGNELNWNRRRSGNVNGDYIFYEDNDEGEYDEEEEDQSLDLLIKFVQNIFKKISRKARKAVRSVLPVTIPSKLVGFSVNGAIILTFMWVLKAFLEVVCTLGSVVFVSILLIRGIWTGMSYIQGNHVHGTDELDDEHRKWTGAQPAA